MQKLEKQLLVHKFNKNKKLKNQRKKLPNDFSASVFFFVIKIYNKMFNDKYKIFDPKETKCLGS